MTTETVFWSHQAMAAMTMGREVMGADSAKYGQSRGRIGKCQVSHRLANAASPEVRSVSRPWRRPRPQRRDSGRSYRRSETRI